MNKSSSFLKLINPKEENETEVKFEIGGRVNTQDTRMQTTESMRARSDSLQQFYNTYSDRLEEVLLSHKKNEGGRQNIKSHRHKNAQFMCPDTLSMLKGLSRVNSEREINKCGMDINNSGKIQDFEKFWELNESVFE